MKIGIIGLPQSGKKTVFRLLTGHDLSEKELSGEKPIRSLMEIKDPRFDVLVDIYHPRKQVRARIDVELLPKIEPESIVKGDIFANIDEVDAICHVIRAFEDASVYHINGSIDALRDIAAVNSELILHDLIFIDKRLERISKMHEPQSAKEKDLLHRFKEHLEEERALRLLKLTPDEDKIIASYPFITRKKMILVLNIGEDMDAGRELVRRATTAMADDDVEIIQISAKVESEIDRLEALEDKQEFMAALGITEPAIASLTRVCLHALDLASFFTAGPNEVHHWTLRAGSTAPEAAGVVHSDLQKGFIRAEVIKFADLIEFGSEDKIKEAGRLLVKGKDYIVEDGDILFIRFNV